MEKSVLFTKQGFTLNPTEQARYRSILAELNSYLDRLSGPLQATARPHFEQMVRGEFSQVAALLPAWLGDLLPTPPQISHRLGLAQLYLWWYYHIQDELLDHQASPAALLSGHLALLQAVTVYDTLGLTRAPCWATFHRLTRSCAETTALELQQARFHSPEELTSERLASFTVQFLIDRVAPFYFTTLAQLHLAELPADDSRHRDLPAALRCFAVARQIGDDATDWLTDLQAGQINYVSARLMSRLYDRGLATSGADLDPDRLTGYQIADEPFWAEIEQTAQTLSGQALDHLAPYGPCRLQALIEHQLNHHAEQWAGARTQRARLREFFGMKAYEE